MSLLKISKLRVFIKKGEKRLNIINSLHLEISPKNITALVGESGCGKTMTAYSILRLLPTNAVVEGEIIFEGKNLLTLTEKEMRKIRGKGISMIFQDPQQALNPVYTIGNQIAEVIKIHRKEAKDIKQEVINTLRMVKMPNPERIYYNYPHQLSGGMQQRSLIGMAIACRPKLLIADEPTTALDVTVQAGILNLLKELKQALGMSVLLITHDLGIVSQIADYVSVMYAGMIVEKGRVEEILSHPCHPYTKGLIESIPELSMERKRLKAIPGNVPSPSALPPGCPFHPRCSRKKESCLREPPPFREHDSRMVACYYPL